MSFLPEWAPNFHPLLVHFPLALLFAAVLLDGGGLFARSKKWPRATATVLYVLGTVGALAAYLTGQAAADAVSLPARAQPVLTDHAEWALWTLLFFSAFTLARLGTDWLGRTRHKSVHGTFVVLGLLGVYLLYQTGDHGAELVFAHGVGVQAPSATTSTEYPPDSQTTPENARAADTTGRELVLPGAGPQVTNNGSWRWTPGERAAGVLADRFEWIEGQPDLVEATVSPAPDPVLSIQATEQSVMFVTGPAVSSIQADLQLNVDSLDGRVRIAHHVQDAQNYDFLEIEGETLRLGRVSGGTPTLFDENPFDAGGWIQLRVVADQDHFRGYIGEELVVHGHGDAQVAGPVGLWLDRSAKLSLRHMQVQTLR